MSAVCHIVRGHEFSEDDEWCQVCPDKKLYAEKAKEHQ